MSKLILSWSPPCGFGTCRICNARVKRFFIKFGKIDSLPPIHHSALDLEMRQEQGFIFFLWRRLYPPSTPNAYTTDYFSSIIFPNFSPINMLPISANFCLGFCVGSFVSLSHVLLQRFSNLLSSNSCISIDIFDHHHDPFFLLCASASHCCFVLCVFSRSLFFGREAAIHC